MVGAHTHAHIHSIVHMNPCIQHVCNWNGNSFFHSFLAFRHLFDQTLEVQRSAPEINENMFWISNLRFRITPLTLLWKNSLREKKQNKEFIVANIQRRKREQSNARIFTFSIFQTRARQLKLSSTSSTRTLYSISRHVHIEWVQCNMRGVL